MKNPSCDYEGIQNDSLGTATAEAAAPQGDDGFWCAVANTKWGHIPGKCRDGVCYFPYGGIEHQTTDFTIV